MAVKVILAALTILASAVIYTERQQASIVRPPTKQEKMAVEGFNHDWNADNKRAIP